MHKIGLSRRALICSSIALPSLLLTGCSGGEKAMVRFRVIARFNIHGVIKEFSNVMEVQIFRITHSLIGNGGASTLYGEALRIDLGSQGRLYLLPLRRQPDGQIQSEYFDSAVPRAFGIKSGLGSLSDGDFEKLRSLQGKKSLSVERLPTFVAFKDESLAASMFEVDPWHMQGQFPGVHLVSVDVEITDQAVTDDLAHFLPWLLNRSGETALPRDPPGCQRPMRDRPLSYSMLESRFFGKGSRPFSLALGPRRPHKSKKHFSPCTAKRI